MRIFFVSIIQIFQIVTFSARKGVYVFLDSNNFVFFNFVSTEHADI